MSGTMMPTNVGDAATGFAAVATRQRADCSSMESHNSLSIAQILIYTHFSLQVLPNDEYKHWLCIEKLTHHDLLIYSTANSLIYWKHNFISSR